MIDLSSNKPHFLCLGSPKSGTTWLHHQLMHHEDIWVPFVKEMHYFNHDNVDRWIEVIYKNTAHGKRVRAALYKGILRGEVRWTYRYLFKKMEHAAYQDLFPDNDLIMGEVTPGYARMSDEKIKQLSQLIPHCKLIYILRNPVDRTWSQMNMKRQKKALRNSSPEEIYARLNQRQMQSSNYLENIDNWLKYFSEKQLHLCFYDELKTDPIVFLNKIYTFLGASNIVSNTKTKRETNQVHNKGLYDTFPMPLRKKLTQHFYEDIIKLHERFNNRYTLGWLEEARYILAN